MVAIWRVVNSGLSVLLKIDAQLMYKNKMYTKASLNLINLIEEGNGKMGARILARINLRKGKTQKEAKLIY